MHHFVPETSQIYVWMTKKPFKTAPKATTKLKTVVQNNFWTFIAIEYDLQLINQLGHEISYRNMSDWTLNQQETYLASRIHQLKCKATLNLRVFSPKRRSVRKYETLLLQVFDEIQNLCRPSAHWLFQAWPETHCDWNVAKRWCWATCNAMSNGLNPKRHKTPDL